MQSFKIESLICHSDVPTKSKLSLNNTKTLLSTSKIPKNSNLSLQMATSAVTNNNNLFCEYPFGVLPPQFLKQQQNFKTTVTETTHQQQQAQLLAHFSALQQQQRFFAQQFMQQQQNLPTTTEEFEFAGNLRKRKLKTVNSLLEDPDEDFEDGDIENPEDSINTSSSEADSSKLEISLTSKKRLKPENSLMDYFDSRSPNSSSAGKNFFSTNDKNKNLNKRKKNFNHLTENKSFFFLKYYIITFFVFKF